MTATNDTEVVKQSVSSMLSVLISMVIAVLLIGFIIYGNKINYELFVGIELLILLIMAIILTRILNKIGTQFFNKIDI